MKADTQFEKITNNWYKRATVRYTPRIKIPSYSSDELIFPIERSVICEHPLVKDLGKDGRSYVLTQSAYQFLYGVGLLETKFVILCCLELLHNRIEGIDNVDKLQALTVLIDEGYHAHVALDYITQMECHSNIKPLLVPETNRNLDATKRAQDKLPKELHADFLLLAVTLAENTLTNEIATIGRESDLTRTFIQLMKDHVLDEGRHSSYFISLMKKRWPQLPADTQKLFYDILPEFLDDFLSVDMSRKFERKVLSSVGLSQRQVEQVIEETNEKFIKNQNNMIEKTKVRLYHLLKVMAIMNIQ
ncbi:diiron oxygenase [Xenorhabdus bovienii]|uniref:diiron oxygenase n=1 Tax=Xenorhabdus bovienii TaxID=40576 RepID=UPI0023B26A1C|nr:diiron oxygenase [Xenorhabdus bovienii]MDE9535027.1 diiron oxygenase [Xenorhabdus bovienii]MDE9587713.1 diiron oxygenase [Xenorhabdus bovienii]